MYERFISSSMLTGTLVAAMSVMSASRLQFAVQRSGLVRASEITVGACFERRPTRNLEADPEPLRSDVEVFHVQRVVLDELAARLDLIAHQRGEHQVGFGVVLGLDLQERPLRG